MGFSSLKFEDFNLYPSGEVTNPDDYFLFGYDDVKLPNLALEMSQFGFPGVTAREMYDGIFQDDLEPHRERGDYRDGEYGGIVIEKVPLFDEKGKPILISKGRYKGEQRIEINRRTYTKGNQELYDLIERSENFVITTPISYAGKSRRQENARFLYAMVIEIDGIKAKTGLNELIYSWQRPNMFKGKKTYARLPQPTYIVCSGYGLHLYFVMQQPILLYKSIYDELSKAKMRWTRDFWSSYVTTLSAEKYVQYESLNQPFRVVGTRSKQDNTYALAFKTGEKCTIEYFNTLLPEKYQITMKYKSKLTLEQAKVKYPEWYQRRIVEKRRKRGETKHFHRNRAVYDSWKQKILSGAKVGKRYNCLENLCSLAVQCNIKEEELLKDADEVAVHFETLTTDENNHFTKSDVISALQTYYNPTEKTYTRKIEYITNKTGIPLQRTKRNGRKQKAHLRRARAVLLVSRYDLIAEGKYETVGRPSKARIVQEWRKNNPNKRKIDCQRETGLSRPTVLKYWDN